MGSDLKGFLANCFIGGPDSEVHLILDDYSISIVPSPNIDWLQLSQYNGRFVPSSTLIIPNVAVTQRPYVLKLLEQIAFLLTFATCSGVALYGWQHKDNKPPATYNSVVASARYFRPVFNLRDTQKIRDYIECVWPEYSRLESPRKLNKAIHLFVLAETSRLPLELKLATMFILLENLKFTFAESEGEPKYRFSEGAWRKPSTKSRYRFNEGTWRKLPERSWSFKELMKEMLSAVGMISSDLKSIIKLRNEIIHSAISQLPVSEQREIYSDCQDLVREYILRLLGYSGSFRLYSGRGIEKKISSSLNN